jgi:hypothetical protein
MPGFRISKDVLTQEVAGETVLLDLASESFFGLDAVGTRVWQLLVEGRQRTEIIESLLSEYEVKRPDLERDIDELLEQLAEAGLLRID